MTTRGPRPGSALLAVADGGAAGMPLRTIMAKLDGRGLMSWIGRPLALTQVARREEEAPAAKPDEAR
jgi:hypothetical protein